MTIQTDMPPVAPRRPFVRELHGDTVSDDYAWMRDPDDPELRQYMAAERRYYDAQTQHLDGLAETLAAEAAGRFPAGDEYSVAWPQGGYAYRTRLPAGRDNEQLLRRKAGEDFEQVMLDENVLAERTGYVEVGVREPSEDGALLAWSADRTGAEIYELRIRDLQTGEDLPEVIEPTYPGIAWSTASDYLFYLVPDELHRPFQVWRHRVGSPPSEDALVLEEPDQRFELRLGASRSGELAIVTAGSRETTEVWVIALARPLDDAVLVEPRREGIEYRIDHARGGDVYVVTNADSVEFALMRAPAGSPGRASWQPVRCPAIAPARADTRLVRCDVFADRLVLTVRRHGVQLLVIADHDGGNVREIEPSLQAGSIRIDHDEDYDRGSVIIVEESLIEPPAWFDLELAGGTRRLLKRLEVPGYDPARYMTEQLTAPARDGTPVPVTIARRADVELDGAAPCLLYGYGAYEDSIDPEFDRSLPMLIVIDDTAGKPGVLDSTIRLLRIADVSKLSGELVLRDIVEFLSRAGRKSGAFRVLSV